MTSSHPLSDATVIARADGVLSRRSGDETVLLNMNRELYFGLNRVGSSVWALIDPQASFRDILDQLHEMYEVERPVLERDVYKLVTELIEGGLVDVDGE